jgi:flagellar assembly protein FliH
VKHGQQTIIRGEKAQKLKPAELKSFDRQPTNYFRDVLSDEDKDGTTPQNEHAYQEQVEQAVAEERQRLQAAHAAELKKQFAAGLQKGKAETSEEIQRALELLSQYAQLLKAEKSEFASLLEKAALDLGFSLAKKIIARELQADSEAVANIVRNAVQQVMDCDHVRVRVNPQDFDYLRTLHADMEQYLSRDAKLELKSDASIERGGCLIETENGMLDARLSSQLETLYAKLKESGSAGIES